MIFTEEWPERRPSLVGNIRRLECIYGKVWNSEKQVCLFVCLCCLFVDKNKYNASGLDVRNCVWRMAGGGKASSSGQTCWWHRHGTRTRGVVRNGTFSFYGRQNKQTR